MDPHGDSNRTSNEPDLDRDHRPHARRKRTRHFFGAGLALILVAFAPAQAAQSEDEFALWVYEELRVLADEGELDAELGLELLQASERLIRIRSADIVPGEAYRAALLAAEAMDAAPARIATKLARFADLLREQGDVAGVIQALEPRLPSLWKHPTDGTLFTLELMLIQVLREAQRWQDAREHLDALMPRIAAAPNPRLYESFARGERASLYMAYGLMDLASLWHERQRDVLGTTCNALRQADFIEANLFLAREEYAELDRRVSEMLTDARCYPRTARQRGRLLIRAGLARIALARTDRALLAAAKEAFSQALEIDLEPFEVRRAHLGLGEAAMLAEDKACALEHIERALSAEISPPPADIHAIGWTLRAHLARGSAQEAEARLALEAALEGLGSAYLGFLETWGRLPLRRGGFGFFEIDDNRRILSELIVLTQSLQPGEAGRRAAFQYVLQAQALSSLVRSIRGAYVEDTIDEIRAELCPPGHGFLIYLPSTYRSHLFLLDDTHLEHVLMEPMDVLRKPQRRLIQRYLQPPPSDAEARRLFLNGRKLCFEDNARLLLPAAARTRMESWTHLTVIAYDLTPLVPFEELPLSNSERLGDRFAVGYLSSLPTGLALARRRANAPLLAVDDTAPEIWMLSNPRPHETFAERFHLQELPLDAAAARAMIDLYAGRRTRFLHGPEARPSVLFSAELAKAKVLHIVAHGAADLEQERPAMLLLGGSEAEQSLLRCADVDRFEAPELVALSACATAKGPNREGDGGAADFEGAFLAAGASCIVLSPYQVEFHASQRLMGVFHRELARGAAPSEALRIAKRELRDDARFAETPLNALMRASGLAHFPIFEPAPATAFSLYWLAALPVAFAAWLLLRRRVASRA